MRHVQVLAGDIGERNMLKPAALARAANYIEQSLASFGYTPTSQSYSVGRQTVRNIEAEIKSDGPPNRLRQRLWRSADASAKADRMSPALKQILIVGAHYDTVPGCPGANDNGSGIGALLELARLFVDRRFARTVRFVAFVNEEPPYFTTDQMGSVVHAKRSRARGEHIAGMFSLETIGYYSSERGSQQYPGSGIFQLLYPDTGDFIAFVSNVASRKLLRNAGRLFRSTTKFPSEGGAAPANIPGVGWSDHWSFWQEGYPAVMLTDTAPYRYSHYHLASDTPEKLDYDSFARVVMGLSRTFAALADSRL